MKEFSVGRRFGAYAVLAAGVILMVVALIMDMSGSGSALRGPLLVMGMVGVMKAGEGDGRQDRRVPGAEVLRAEPLAGRLLDEGVSTNPFT